MARSKAGDPVAYWAMRVALAHRKNRDGYTDPAKIAEARAKLAEAKLEQAITKALHAAPPLTDEQRSKLVMLVLQGGGSR